jgi:hypothetical protein
MTEDRRAPMESSFRTESQSFLPRAVPRVRAGARLENRHRRTLPFGKRWANESQQLDVSTMALTLSFNAAKRVCNRVCGRARLEIQSAFESRRRFTPALIVLPAVCDALFQHFAR